MATERTELLGAPLHGFQGDRGELPLAEGPLGLSVAITRESGSRGGSIARLLGRRLGWQVYNQELLEYMSSSETAREEVLRDLPADASAWAEHRLELMQREGRISHLEDLGGLPHLMLMLAARGRVIFVGRGAGYLLPGESTLHARMIAPEAARVGYLSLHLRLTAAAAEEQMRQRDRTRGAFLSRHFGLESQDNYGYDLILNSLPLGEEACSQLLATAARSREARWSERVG